MYRYVTDKKLSFDMHVEQLKKQLDISPTVLKGSAAEEFISKYEYKVSIRGGYDAESNTVAVKDPTAIGTLAHEMRHAWQYKNRTECSFDFSKPTTDLLTYMISKKEWDANMFAYQYCKQNSLASHGQKAMVLLLLSA